MNIHCVRCGQPVRTTNLTCCNMQYALDGTVQPIGPSTEEALRAWLAHKNSAKPEGPPAAVSAHEIEEDRLRGVLSEAHLGALDARVHNASLQRRCAPCAHHDARHDDDAGPFCSKGAECHDGQDGADLTRCKDYTPVTTPPGRGDDLGTLPKHPLEDAMDAYAEGKPVNLPVAYPPTGWQPILHLIATPPETRDIWLYHPRDRRVVSYVNWSGRPSMMKALHADGYALFAPCAAPLPPGQ